MADPDGTPIWFELTTPDQDGASGFYAAVAGWQVVTSPAPEHGGYRIASAPDGGTVAGIMARQGGMPGGWSIYFAAADVDATAARVAELGGRVHVGPMDIPHVGRFVAASDPQGVMFNVMTSADPAPSTAFVQAEPGNTGGEGHGVWVELATPDPDAAIDFYAALFGWSRQGAMPMPVPSDAAGGVEGGETSDYTFVGTDAFRPGAVMSSRTTGAPARWRWYVDVADIDAAVATARAKGGTLAQGPDEIPGGSYSANIVDAQGFAIGLVGPRIAGSAA